MPRKSIAPPARGSHSRRPCPSPLLRELVEGHVLQRRPRGIASNRRGASNRWGLACNRRAMISILQRSLGTQRVLLQLGGRLLVQQQPRRRTPGPRPRPRPRSRAVSSGHMTDPLARIGPFRDHRYGDPERQMAVLAQAFKHFHRRRTGTGAGHCHKRRVERSARRGCGRRSRRVLRVRMGQNHKRRVERSAQLN